MLYHPLLSKTTEQNLLVRGMAKAITIIKHDTEEELRKEISTTKDGRYRLRVQTVLLVMQGLHSEQIMQQLLISRNSIFRWVQWYNEDGLEGLKNVSVGGRAEGNPKWDDTIFIALFEKLDTMEEFWSVPKMQSWIEEQYNLKIPVNTIHNRLRVNGYTFKSSRPNPYKGDPDLQAAFKKTEL